MNDKETYFEPPCTVICPANMEHQFFNTGDKPGNPIGVLGVTRLLVDASQTVMHLPWTK